jgi:hypothetical protein
MSRVGCWSESIEIVSGTVPDLPRPWRLVRADRGAIGFHTLLPQVTRSSANDFADQMVSKPMEPRSHEARLFPILEPDPKPYVA